jgi:hypothetical protein
MERYLGSVERHQQLKPISALPFEQTIKGDKAGASAKDAVEANTHFAVASRGELKTVALEVAVEPPDQLAHESLGGALKLGEGIELVRQLLRVHPAEGMLTHDELAGIVADDHRVGQQVSGYTKWALPHVVWSVFGPH